MGITSKYILLFSDDALQLILNIAHLFSNYKHPPPRIFPGKRIFLLFLNAINFFVIIPQRIIAFSFLQRYIKFHTVYRILIEKQGVCNGK